MGIHRLNHAVLYVRDLKRSVEFYTEVLGFRVVDMTPDGFRGAAFLQAPGSTNDHDLGLFEIGAAAGPARPAAARSGCTTSPGRSTRSTTLEAMAAPAGQAGALVGSSDHGTTKSLYGKDPDGLEFEVVWLIPADLLDDEARQARKRIGPLDLAKEKQQFGGQTRGGVGISVPV